MSLEDKIKKQLAEKLRQCEAGIDYLLFVDGDIVSTTKHTNGQIATLIRQAKGIARYLKFSKESDFLWKKDNREIKIELYEGAK